MPAANAAQTKGKENFSSQGQAAGKNSAENACYYCGSADHWMKDCPHRSTQSASSTGQSSSSGMKNQPVKNQPKPTMGQKGKGKGKKNGKKKTSSRGKNRPSARAVEGEEKEEPEYDIENQENEEETSGQPFDPSSLKKKNRLIKKNNLSR